ncbi:unnamed protein product [Urochloa humidicola]
MPCRLSSSVPLIRQLLVSDLKSVSTVYSAKWRCMIGGLSDVMPCRRRFLSYGERRLSDEELTALAELSFLVAWWNQSEDLSLAS